MGSRWANTLLPCRTSPFPMLSQHCTTAEIRPHTRRGRATALAGRASEGPLRGQALGAKDGRGSCKGQEDGAYLLEAAEPCGAGGTGLGAGRWCVCRPAQGRAEGRPPRWAADRHEPTRATSPMTSEIVLPDLQHSFIISEQFCAKIGLKIEQRFGRAENELKANPAGSSQFDFSVVAGEKFLCPKRSWSSTMK